MQFTPQWTSNAVEITGDYMFEELTLNLENVTILEEISNTFSASIPLPIKSRCDVNKTKQNKTKSGIM